MLGAPMRRRGAHCRRAARGLLCAALAALMLTIHGGAGCLRTERLPDPDGGRSLSSLGQGSGVQSTVNRLPDPVTPDPKRVKPIPLTTTRPDAAPADGPPADAAERALAEAAGLLHRSVVQGRLTCRAFDPVTRRPLEVLIRAVADGRAYDAYTDAVRGETVLQLPVGRVNLYCAAGEFFTPYTNQIDLQAGENTVEVLLTQVPELNPSRSGFVTLSLARGAPTAAAAGRRGVLGQADWSLALGATVPTGDLVALDGPGGPAGSRFAGIGVAPPPKLAFGAPVARLSGVEASVDPGAGPQPLQQSIAPFWDDLHRLQQAGYLRLWLFPAGRPTDPQLARLLGLPERQYRGAEGWLCAERGPGLELVTLGSRGEGEAEYFTLLNRGLPVAAVAEPELSAPPPADERGRPLSHPDMESYQSLMPDLYEATLTPRTLVRMGQFTPLAARPSAADTLQWLRAGQVQVAYGPVLDWKIREFAEAAGYPAQPIPAADRLYHLDLSAFVGPGAPPEYRSIQLIELLRNGQVVARLPIDRPLQSVRGLTFEIRETARCWYLLRAYSGAPAENRSDTRLPQPHWRRSWSAPIHFAALQEVEAPTYERRALPVAIHAFRAVDGSNQAPAGAEALVVRGGFLVQKIALVDGRGELTARVGDHILVGGPGWEWRETVVSPYENRSGDPWRAMDAELPPPEPGLGVAVESAAAANARLSGLGILCPLTPRQVEQSATIRDQR